MTITNTLRSVTFADLMDQLQREQAAKFDNVVRAENIQAQGGQLVITTADGPVMLNPNPTMLAGMATRLRIPGDFLREVHGRASEQIDPAKFDDLADLLDVMAPRDAYQGAFDALVNARLGDARNGKGEAKSFLVRAFRDDTTGEYEGRALLSANYRLLDHLDAATALGEGLMEAGVMADAELTCNLSPNRMWIRVGVPSIGVLADKFLEGYVNPLRNLNMPGHRAIEKRVFAGIELRNSETGGGRFVVVPMFIVQICDNGATITRDALGEVHLGGRMEDGAVTWSDATRTAELDLIRNRTRDAVTRFLSQDYVEAVVAEVEAKAIRPVDDMIGAVETVAKELRFSEAEQRSVLDMMLKGGQSGTAGAVMQAVTAAAQVVPDPERAKYFEDQAVRVLDLVG